MLHAVLLLSFYHCLTFFVYLAINLYYEIVRTLSPWCPLQWCVCASVCHHTCVTALCNSVNLSLVFLAATRGAFCRGEAGWHWKCSKITSHLHTDTHTAGCKVPEFSPSIIVFAWDLQWFLTMSHWQQTSNHSWVCWWEMCVKWRSTVTPAAFNTPETEPGIAGFRPMGLSSTLTVFVRLHQDCQH